MGIPLPTYGAFGGNGDNDAWEQASRYITWALNGDTVNGVPAGVIPIVLDANGHPSVLTPPSWMQRFDLPRVSENIGAVANIVTAIGREPVDDLDGLYLRHDLLSMSDETIATATNNYDVAADVFTELTSSGDYGFTGTVYGYLSALGLPTIGTVIQPFLDFGSNYTPANDQSLTFQDEYTVEPVIIVASRDSNGVIHAVVDGVIELSASAYQAGRDMWNSFASGVDYSIKSFLGFVSETAAGIGGILDKTWTFIRELFAAPSPDYMRIGDDGDSHHGLTIVEINKEKNTAHDKDVLALIHSMQKSGAISLVSLDNQAEVTSFLTAALENSAQVARRADITESIALAETYPVDTVHLVGIQETHLIAA